MKKFLLSSLLLTCGIPSAYAATAARSLVVLSPVYKIDKEYKSMEGPQSTQPVYVLQSQTPELLWITGFKTEMVAADGVTPSLPEFMCHVNLDYDTGLHARLFNLDTGRNARLLTLSQGQLQAQFPDGFGLPIMSNEPLSMTTQVLNFNLKNPNLQVRHKVTFDFIRDQETKEPMKPLFNTSGFGMALLEGKDGLYGVSAGDESTHGPSCLPGETAPNAAGGSVYKDQFSRKFTGHWVVKPGREVNHTNITKYLNLPYDTTLHYAAVHLHPFAESLELRDLTTKKKIFKSHARGEKNKIGLSYVDSFSSKKGIPLFKSHEYALISTYNNTTQINQDSMAVMLLFLLDKQFKKPVVPAVPAVTAPSLPIVSAPMSQTPSAQRPHLVLRTTAGDLLVELDPDAAPLTVWQIVKLVKANVYNTTPFYRIEPGFVIQTSNVHGRSQPLSSEQRALVQKLPGEFSSLKHQRGVLSMAREDHDLNSAESSFSILLGDAPHLDGKYTVFGKVIAGWNVLKALETAPRDPKNQPSIRLEIIKAEVVAPGRPVSKIKLQGPKPLPKASSL